MAAAAAVGVTPDPVVTQSSHSAHFGGTDSVGAVQFGSSDSMLEPSQSLPPSTYGVSEQSYSQKYHNEPHYSQSLAADATSSHTQPPSSAFSEHVPSMEQSVAMSTGAATSDLPQPIPMPNQPLIGQFDPSDSAAQQVCKHEQH